MTNTSSTVSAKTEATRVTMLGMWLDIALGLAKIIGGVLSNSFALVTDGIHSLTDVISDVFVLIVARIGLSEADEEHPWGHGRFETLGTVAMGMLFFATAGVIGFNALQRLVGETQTAIPTTMALVIAGISVMAKEWIFQYTMAVANKLNSSLLRANAWHSRSDAFSSIAVIVGVVAAQAGYAWMDIMAALCIAVIIAKVGWDLSLDSLKELVDTAIPAHRREEIEKSIKRVDEVRGVTKIRSRKSGGKVILEISLQVDADMTVLAGHEVGEQVCRSLKGNFSDIEDVIAHIDPISSEIEPPLEH